MSEVRDNIDTIDSLGDALIERALPDLNTAAMAIVDGTDPALALATLRTKLSQSIIILYLLGYAARRRPLAKRGIVPRVKRSENSVGSSIATFARFAEPSLVRMPFLRALEAFRSDVPELASVVRRAQAGALQTATSAVERTRRSLQTALARVAIPETVGALGGVGVAGESFREAVAAAIGREGKGLLDTEVRTTMMSGFNQGGRASIQDNLSAVPITQLSEIQDRRTRGNPRGSDPDAGPHFQMDGFAAPSDDPVWEIITPPNGWNCLLPGQVVSGRFVAARRAWYEGPAVEIETRNGHRLTVTINHPICTEFGWKSAASITKGDRCLRDLGHTELVGQSRFPLASRGAIRNQHPPALVEDVFEALGSHGRGSTEVSPLDFHGDASGFVGQIDVVGSDVELMNEGPSESFDGPSDSFLPVPDLNLMDEPTPGHRASCLPGLLTSSHSVVSRSDLCGALVAGHPLPLRTLRIGSISHHNIIADEPSLDGGCAESGFPRELLDAHPRQISLDEVVGIRYFDWSHWVYDLESDVGWYVCSDIIAHNCRGSIRGVPVQEAIRRRWVRRDDDGVPVIDRDLLRRKFARQWRFIQSGAYPDAGFA